MYIVPMQSRRDETSNSSPTTGHRDVNPKAAVPIMLTAFVLCLMIDNGFKFMTSPIAHDLHLSENTASLQASLAGIVIGIGAMVYAALADSVSIRTLLIIGMALVGVGSLIGFLFHGVWPMVLTGRLIQTSGLACAETLYVIYVTKHLPEKDQKTYLGFSTSAFQLAMLLGVLTSGVVATYISWTAMFLVALILVLTIPVIVRTVPAEETTQAHVDVLGLFLIAVFSSSLIIFVGNFAWLPAVVALVGIALFIWHIHAHGETIVQPEFFHNGRYVTTLLVVLVVYSTQLGLSAVVIPGAVQYVHHQTLATASFLIVPGYAVGAIVGALSGQIGRRLTSRRAILTALGLILVALVLTACLISQNTWVLVIAMMLFSAGFAMMYAPLVNTAIADIPAQKTGIAIGFYNLTINLAIPLGIAYSSKLADSRIHLLGGTGVAATYSSILWILAIIAAAGIAIFLIADHRLGRSSV